MFVDYCMNSENEKYWEQEEKENENGVGNREENGDDKTEVVNSK